MAKIISVLGWILLIWFFWSRQVYAGGIPGEVIDYTLLEKLQKEYATSSEIYTGRPQISATRTERVIDKIEVEDKGLIATSILPQDFFTRQATSTEQKIKIGSIIFAVIIVALVGWIWYNRR